MKAIVMAAVLTFMSICPVGVQQMQMYDDRSLATLVTKAVGSDGI